MGFDFTHKDLGRVRAGSKTYIHFPYDADVANIGGISLSCGCSGAHHYPISREIVLTFNAQPVPQHMKGQGFYKVLNHATVETIMNDGNMYPFTLSFEATIY